MKMKNHQDQMKIISSCPVCGLKNFPADINILNENEDSHLLHVKCKKCQSKVLILITFSPTGLSSVGLLTDLDSEEINKFSAFPAVGSDDVLQLHEWLYHSQENFLTRIKN